ncbi:hypothetical protein N9E11_04350, partial [Crocinitomicaceae bacterium]|nr:hypothetical protein [Crocinitomicaceae bacterium]
MIHLKKPIAVFAGIALLFSACKKEDSFTIPPPEPIPSSVELQSYFNQNTLDELQAFTIDAASNESITSSNGTQISFYSNSFKHANGALVT